MKDAKEAGSRLEVTWKVGNTSWCNINAQLHVNVFADSSFLTYFCADQVWICRTSKVNVEGFCLCVSSGCEVEILGIRPSFCEKYFYNPSEKNLTDAVINALQVLR